MSSTTYRFESARLGRAGCQNKACKDAGIKIGKGELRFGVLVEINEHSGWKWKHWGCVTPKQIGNIVEQLGGLDGLDLDKDLDILDGYDELPPEYQNKVKYALENGHVHDEDWKGLPELNRPGMKGINKRTPKKKKAGDGDTGDSAAEQSPSKPKKGGRKRKTDADEEDEQPVPKKKASRKRNAVDDDDEEADQAPPKKKKTTQAKTKKAAVKEEDLDDDEPTLAAPKKQRGKKAKAEPQNEDAALPQADGSAELSTGKVVDKGQAKKRGRKLAVKEESDVEQDSEPKPVVKSGRSKKVKTEPAADDQDGLNDVDKKQQIRAGRNKKAAYPVIPGSEQTEGTKSEDPGATTVDNHDGDTGEAETDTKAAKPSKKGRASRGSRTSRIKI